MLEARKNQVKERYCMSGEAQNGASVAPVMAPFDPELHGGGLTEEQRAERVIAYDEPTYGFVRMATEALRDAGMIPTVETGALDEGASSSLHFPSHRGSSPSHLLLERLHLTATTSALQAVGPKNNPFLTPLQNTLRKSTKFQSALHAFVRREVCPALGVRRVAYQRRPTFRRGFINQSPLFHFFGSIDA